MTKCNNRDYQAGDLKPRTCEKCGLGPCPNMTREQTYGEKAVGLSFNPSADPKVDRLKRLYADIIDLMNETRASAGLGEATRLCSVAITEAQGAQMWAVKAVTWR